MLNFFRSRNNSIFIPFRSYLGRLGGPSTFMGNLQNYLDEVEFSYTDLEKSSKQLAGIFFPISYPNKKLLADLKHEGKPIIQRLDGISYPQKHGEEYKAMNAQVEDIYRNYASHIIFQSEYSRKQCFEMFGEKLESDYSTIVNGVRADLFSPNLETQEIKKGEEVKFISTGNFRDISMVEPLIEAFNQIGDQIEGREYSLHLVGPVNDSRIEKYKALDYVVWHEPGDLEYVSKLLSNSHIFLYSHLNPPCPNSVLEAVASGLPVAGFDSGSMKELVYFNSDLLAEVSDDTFQSYDQFDSQKLAEKIVESVKNYDEYRKLALEHCNEYSFTQVGEKYIQVFNDQLEN